MATMKADVRGTFKEGGNTYFVTANGAIFHWKTTPCSTKCPGRCAKNPVRQKVLNILVSKISKENGIMPTDPTNDVEPEVVPLSKVEFDPSQLVIFDSTLRTDQDKIRAMLRRRNLVRPILAGLAKSNARENILLWGAVGCGKTSEADFYVKTWLEEHGIVHEVERIQCTRSQDDWSLLGTFSMREGKDMGEWIPGPAVRAMRDGVPLIIDEIDLGDITSDILTAILDGSDAGARVPLPDGSYVAPKPGFRVIATSNKPATDLDFRITNRLSAIPVNVPSKEMISALPADLVQPCLATYLKAQNGGEIDVTYRDFARYGRFRETVGPELLANNVSEHDALLTCAMLALGRDQVEAQRFLETIKLGSR